jgi:hypothetical protein
MSTSTFRRKVNKLYGIAPGQAIRDWVMKNCSFAYFEISDPDVRSAVEALTILFLRNSGCKLLNSV